MIILIYFIYTFPQGTGMGLEEAGPDDDKEKKKKEGDSSGEREDLLSSEWRGKKPPNEDEEPPPPYTEVDPLQEDEKDKKEEPDEPSSERSAQPKTGTRSVTPSVVSKKTRSPQSFSRTRSDDPVPSRHPLTSQNSDNSHISQRLMESTSEETLVYSSSYQDLHLSR